jgi:hypothetical protein
MFNPFEFNKIASKDNFIGRNEEVKKLSSNHILLTNTALMAPQGWGKSSLVRMSAELASRGDKDIRFCHVSLSNVRNEERFHELLAKGLLQSVSKTQEDVISYVTRCFAGVRPKVSFGEGDALDFSVDFDWDEIRRHQDELLDLPYIVARDADVKMVVCIDDFQNISLFANPDAFIGRISSVWTNFDKVAFCISGTSCPLMDRFVKTSRMFTRYGEVLNLGPVASDGLVTMLRDRFADSGKYLDNEYAGLIVSLSEGNLFYMWRLANLSWLGTGVVCSEDVVLNARETLVDQMSLVFETMTASLTTQQICYLHAVMAGETVISTAEVLHRHHITSATSASRSKTALLDKGMVSNVGGRIAFADPIYAYWLKSRYFVEK